MAASLPSLRNLRYLVALSERLNFTQAAERCFVTQSTLSAGIKELEESLGVQLVERDRQRVLMTDVGNEIVRRAREILGGAQELVEVARAHADPLGGSLALGVIPTIAPFLLPRVLPAVREALPNLRLALREDLTATLLEAVRAGTLDAALIALPYRTDELAVVTLFDEELWLVARPGDPAATDADLTVKSLDRDRLLLLAEGHCLREQTLAACDMTPPRRTDERFEATSLLTLIQMIDQGWGIGLVPEMSMKTGVLQRTELVARPLPPPAPTRTIALVARASSPRRPALDGIGESIRAWHREMRGAHLRPGSARRRSVSAVASARA